MIYKYPISLLLLFTRIELEIYDIPVFSFLISDSFLPRFVLLKVTHRFLVVSFVYVCVWVSDAN